MLRIGHRRRDDRLGLRVEGKRRRCAERELVACAHASAKRRRRAASGWRQVLSRSSPQLLSALSRPRCREIRTRQEAGGRSGSPRWGEHAGEAAQSTAVSRTSRSLAWIRRLDFSIEAALRPGPRRARSREGTQRARLHAVVVRGLRSAEVVLVERSRAFIVAEVGVDRREIAGHQQGRVLVAELTEDPGALPVELVCPDKIIFPLTAAPSMNSE